MSRRIRSSKVGFYLKHAFPRTKLDILGTNLFSCRTKISHVVWWIWPRQLQSNIILCICWHASSIAMFSRTAPRRVLSTPILQFPLLPGITRQSSATRNFLPQAWKEGVVQFLWSLLVGLEAPSSTATLSWMVTLRTFPTATLTRSTSICWY